jgi:hypothetical protein
VPRSCKTPKAGGESAAGTYTGKANVKTSERIHVLLKKADTSGPALRICIGMVFIAWAGALLAAELFFRLKGKLYGQ